MAERKIVRITDLIINTTNARFITPIEDLDEKFAIEALCNDRDNHMHRLIDDIAKNDLNANELPIIMPSTVMEGKYEVMDGNRRLSCIKLLLQYKEQISNFDIPRVVINKVNSIKNINVNNKIECVCSEDDEYINDLLEKLHTHNTGISTVPWKPLAQERHNYYKGTITKVNAIIRFLETSQYSNEIIISNLNKRGWIHKYKRFIGNNKTVRNYFGFEFSKDLKRIFMYLNEKEIVKGLGKLLQDALDNNAEGFAQKEKQRHRYLQQFEYDNIIDKNQINDPVLAYHIEDGHISATTIEPFAKPKSKTDKQDASQSQNKARNSNGSTKTEETSDKGKNDKSEPPETVGKDETDNRGKEEKKDDTGNTTKTTDERSSLIPKEVTYVVNDQRSLDLFRELQETKIKGHRNLVAIGFRSLIEFSVIVFIERKSPKYNVNGKNLIDKIDHTVSKLESKYGMKKLKNKIPKVYQLLNTRKGNTSEFGDIKMLNLFVHCHKFHPQEDDLKLIYQNYEPYLELLWEEINPQN